MKQIYLDYSATTPVDLKVFQVMEPYFAKDFGNPNSIHCWGQKARKAVEKSRKIVAQFLHCQPEEVIFTSCATEANNLAIKGTVEAWKQKNPGKTPHLIVSSIEHHCVLETAQHLEKQGAEISWLKVDQFGLVDVYKLRQLIKENTVLISVMYGNNEVGVIEPIVKIGNEVIRSKGNKLYPLFHTDAVQAIQYLDCNVDHLGVDLLSASAHKFYGPKGIGFLYIKKGTPVVKQMNGGSQEFGLRAGTENTASIVGLGKAIELIVKDQGKEGKRLTKLRNYFIKNLKLKVKRAKLTGHPKQRLPHIASFIFSGAEGEAILLSLNDKGVGVSSGSACTSGNLAPSHVLLAMGIKSEFAHGSIRFSFGKKTSKKDLDYVLKVLPGIIKKLRMMNPISVIK